MKTTEKYEEYAVKILLQISEMFDEDCENYIDLEELMENDNANHFTHALATLAPLMMIKKLTQEDFDALGFNHMVNRLAAQFTNFTKKEE